MTIETLRAESKETVRRPTAKVRITWTDPLIDNSIITEQSENNYVSHPQQVADLVNEVPRKWFHTNDHDVTLDGTWFPPPSSQDDARRAQMGWWGVNACDANGDWAPGSYPTLTVDFAARLVEGYVVTGDSALNEFPVDFTIQLQQPLMGGYATLETIEVTGNTSLTYSAAFSQSHNRATRTILTVKKWNTPLKVVKIAEFYTAVVEEFGTDDIISMNILQEFEDSEGTLPVGNISCNEIDLKLQNIDDRFFPGNLSSDIHTFIKRNRRIEAYLGFQYKTGEIEYLSKGVYWSGDWGVSDLDTAAQTSARDRFELLRKRDFPHLEVFPDELTNVTLKSLMETVLESLTSYMVDFFYDVSDIDESYIVENFLPEFFEKKTYFDVVKDITTAALAYSYMDIPTDAERDANGTLCKDIMRTVRLSTVFPEYPNRSTAIEYTKDDFIDKNQPAKSEEIANVVNVIYKKFTFVTDPEKPEEPGEWEDEEFTASAQDDLSIREYGTLSYDFEASDLIQFESHAQEIADILVRSYAVDRRDIEMNSFGDITQNLADKIVVPDYQKNGVNTVGTFAVTRLNAAFDGSLRIQVDGRKLVEDPFEGDTITEGTGGADTITEGTGGADTITEG